MRRVLVYLLGLAAASAAVFFAAYFLGRHPSLEAELERLTAPRTSPQKSAGIPSLRPQETPPEAPAAPTGPAYQEMGEGILLKRTPLGEPGLVLVVDLEALGAPAGASPEGGRSLREGLEAFLASPPAGLRIGLRSLGSAAGECGSTALLKGCGVWGAGELRAALDPSNVGGRGFRNTSRALREAAADLEPASGGRAVVVLAGGPEACGADLCAEPPSGEASPRTHVILLPVASPEPAEPPAPLAPVMQPPGPSFQPGVSMEPPAEPPWLGPFRCLAERTGGMLAAAADPGELEAQLRAVARSLEAAIVVRATHLGGRDVQGQPPETGEGWGVSLSPHGGEGGDATARVAAGLPGVFEVPAGSWDVRCWYGSLEKTAAVTVAPGERAELSVAFVTAELFVQAQEPGRGEEIVGDSAGFGCAWGAEVLAGEERVVASTCSLPARFELPPGSYRARVRWKGRQRLLEGIGLEGGESTVRVVVFGDEAE